MWFWVHSPAFKWKVIFVSIVWQIKGYPHFTHLWHNGIFPLEALYVLSNNIYFMCYNIYSNTFCIYALNCTLSGLMEKTAILPLLIEIFLTPFTKLNTFKNKDFTLLYALLWLRKYQIWCFFLFFFIPIF